VWSKAINVAWGSRHKEELDKNTWTKAGRPYMPFSGGWILSWWQLKSLMQGYSMIFSVSERSLQQEHKRLIKKLQE